MFSTYCPTGKKAEEHNKSENRLSKCELDPLALMPASAPGNQKNATVVQEAFNIYLPSEFRASHGIDLSAAGFKVNYTLRHNQYGKKGEDVFIGKAPQLRQLLSTFEKSTSMEQSLILHHNREEQPLEAFEHVSALGKEARGLSDEKRRSVKTQSQVE